MKCENMTVKSLDLNQQCGLSRLTYAVSGTGSPVILMHGWGCTSATVASIAAMLDSHYTVYNLDMPGSGASADPAEPWHVEDYDRMLEALVAAEDIKNPCLIGHSNGGRVAIKYASHHDVSRLVLIDAAGVPAVLPPHKVLKIKLFKFAKRVLTAVLGERLSSRMIDSARGSLGSADYNNSSPVMRATMVNLLAEDLRGIMPHIKCPTLLLWGNDDTATPLSDARQMERLIPEAGLVSWQGYGHYSFVNNPGFAPVLQSFMKIDK